MSTSSFSGARWSLAEVDARRVDILSDGAGVSPVIARLLALRGLVEADDAVRFLSPGWRDFHDPFSMAGMDIAVARVREAVKERQHVRIVTDYDVDGTTSSMILQSTLAVLGLRSVDYHIPDRFQEGYGFSPRAAQAAVDDGVSLLITADVGVRDHEAVSLAHRAGVDVIICDHHLPAGAQVPADAHAVLCPPQQECSYPNPDLAACGVSLKLAQALVGEELRGADFRRRFLRSLTKMAAIGTVADVVDLSTPENRAIVTLGLNAMTRGPNAPGLVALLDVAGCEGAITAQDLGYRVGPRINAAGRLEHARLVVDLLSQRDIQRARVEARNLDQLNSQRQAIQERLFHQILDRVAGLDSLPLFPVFAGPEGDGWHRGVVGIVASKLREKLHRPVAVAALLGDVATGSVRSVPEVDAVKALDSAESLLTRYGGHPAAAGFSLPAARLGALQERLSGYVQVSHGREDLRPVRQADLRISTGALGWELARDIARLRPFGRGNPRPLLWLDAGRITAIRTAKGRHIFFPLAGVDAVWWGGARYASELQAGPMYLLGTLAEDTWRGRTRLRFTVEDARPAD